MFVSLVFMPEESCQKSGSDQYGYDENPDNYFGKELEKQNQEKGSNHVMISGEIVLLKKIDQLGNTY